MGLPQTAVRCPIWVILRQRLIQQNDRFTLESGHRPGPGRRQLGAKTGSAQSTPLFFQVKNRLNKSLLALSVC